VEFPRFRGHFLKQPTACETREEVTHEEAEASLV